MARPGRGIYPAPASRTHSPLEDWNDREPASLTLETPPLPVFDSTVRRRFLKLGAGEAIARLIGFGATVYLAKTLGASGYGVVVLATTVLLYLTVITNCGLEGVGIRDVAANPDALARTLPSILSARLAVGAVLIAITVFVGLVIMPQPDGAVLAAYVFVLGPVALGTRWVHLGFERPNHASLGRIVTEAISLVLILLLVHGPGDVVHTPVAQLVGEGLGAIVVLLLLPPAIRRLPVSFDTAVVKDLFRTSWPLVLNALLGLAMFNSDFLFLRGFRDSRAVGLYAAAYTLVSFCMNLGTGYTISLLPAMTRLREDVTAAKKLYDRSMVQVLAGALPIAVGGAMLAAPLLLLVFGDRYAESTTALTVLMWSIPAALIRYVAQTVLIARGRPDQLLRTVVWAAALNLVLNLTLIPAFGMTGAAIATVATEVVRMTMVVIWVARHRVSMTRHAAFLRLLIATAVMAGTIALLGNVMVPLFVAAGALSYFVALTLVGGLRFRRGALPEIVA